MSDTSSTNTSGTGILNRGKEVTFKKYTRLLNFHIPQLTTPIGEKN